MGSSSGYTCKNRLLKNPGDSRVFDALEGIESQYNMDRYWVLRELTTTDLSIKKPHYKNTVLKTVDSGC